MSKLCVSFIYYALTVSAGPVENSIVSWQSEPNVRGTWSILSSCLVTLILCVYTALHTNVPPASQSVWHRRMNMVQWVFFGIIAPELVLWTAWQQHATAKRLTKEVKAFASTLGDNPEKRSLQTFLESWTIKHSFFVIMGGYQFRPGVLVRPFADGHERCECDYWSCPHDKNYKRCPTSVLSATGLMNILELGKGDKLPWLTVQDIDDRSKADKLAKLLSCIQGFWLIIQITSRLVSKLTITELEVNTLAHVMCAMSMYTLWWKKPLNVEQPVWLDDECLKKWASTSEDMPRDLQEKIVSLEELCQYRLKSQDCHTEILTHRYHQVRQSGNCTICSERGDAERYPEVKSTLILGDDVITSLEDTISALNSGSTRRIYFDFVTHQEDYSPEDDRENQLELRVDQCELKAMLEWWNTPERDAWLQAWITEQAKPFWTTTSSKLWSRSSMIPPPSMDSPWSICVMAVVSALYGGVHASLWQHLFPTATELWMWRVSSLFVAGNGVFLGVGLTLEIWNDERRAGDVLRQIKRVGGRYRLFFLIDAASSLVAYLSDETTVVGRVATKLFIIFLACSQPIVVFCRIFLFVEAFISLRSQPSSAYDTPDWSQWLPHL